MMPALVVDHDNLAIFDAFGKATASLLRHHRISFIPKNQQAPDARQAFGMEGVNELKLLLKVRLSGDGLMSLHPQSSIACQVQHARKVSQARDEMIKMQDRIAEVATAGKQNTVTDPGITLGGRGRNEPS